MSLINLPSPGTLEVAGVPSSHQSQHVAGRGEDVRLGALGQGLADELLYLVVLRDVVGKKSARQNEPEVFIDFVRAVFIGRLFWRCPFPVFHTPLFLLILCF